MDFLDPDKSRRHQIVLFTGYVLIGIAILIATVVLLYLAYGFGVGKNGQVIQKGLVYVSSTPNPAQIYLNGQKNPGQTNTRLFLPAGSYAATLSRAGYYDWKRQISVEGGSVQHFDYPRLFPTSLVTKPLQAYTGAPILATQSPDRRWLLVARADAPHEFEVFDLKTPAKLAATVTVPATIASAGTVQGWQLVEWSNDNQHVLLQHTFDGKAELIMLDRNDPTQSVNLSTLFGTAGATVSLINKKYDQYYLYDQTAQTLSKASLDNPVPVRYLDHVLAYKSYGDDTMLYATDLAAPAGKVSIKLMVGSTIYPIRDVPAGTTYLLDLATYSGNLYVLAGANSEGKVYVYKDPVGQLQSQPKQPAVPKRTLRVAAPTYAGFSPNTQFMIAQGGQQVAVFDAENVKGYNYILDHPIDQPQPRIYWMDGDRLTYVSGGKTVVEDYDSTNLHELVSALPGYTAFFSPDYKYLYAIAPDKNNGAVLDQTALLTPQDL